MCERSCFLTNKYVEFILIQCGIYDASEKICHSDQKSQHAHLDNVDDDVAEEHREKSSKPCKMVRGTVRTPKTTTVQVVRLVTTRVHTARVLNLVR
jgi:hypothetical protein